MALQVQHFAGAPSPCKCPTALQKRAYLKENGMFLLRILVQVLILIKASLTAVSLFDIFWYKCASALQNGQIVFYRTDEKKRN